MVRFRSILWILVCVCTLCCILNLIPLKSGKLSPVLGTFRDDSYCYYQQRLIDAHSSTIDHWKGLFQRQFNSLNVSFGLHASDHVSCRIKMSNYSSPIIQGYLDDHPFSQWSYSYQTGSIVLVRANDHRCRLLTNDNAYLCIDYIRAVSRALKKATLNSLAVIMLNDVTSSDLELMYLYYTLVIRYIIGEGIMVLPAADQKLATNATCALFSSVIADQTDAGSLIGFRSAVQSVHDVISSSKRQCKLVVPESLHALCSKHIHTRKYEPRCLPSIAQYKEVIRLMTNKPSSMAASTVGVFPVLITGLGGSGTHNVANLFNDVGIDVAHEGVGSFGSVSWMYAANDWSLRTIYPYGALTAEPVVPYSGLLVPRFRHVFHLVRHPLRQISSVTSHSNLTYDFILQFVKKSGFEDNLVNKFVQARKVQTQCFRGGSCHLYFAALSWVYWNRHVHSYADETYSVEKPHNLFEAVCSLAYSDASSKIKQCVDRVDTLFADGSYSHQDTANSWWSYLESLGRYRSSRAHRLHQSFSMEDISKIDPALAVEIAHDVVVYGQNMA